MKVFAGIAGVAWKFCLAAQIVEDAHYAPYIARQDAELRSLAANEAITLEMQGLATTNLPFAENGLPFVAETVAATDDTIANKRDMLKDFLKAEIRGWTDAVADPQAGADLALNTYGADLGLDPAKTLAGSKAQNALVVSDETAKNGLFTISDALQKMTIDSLAGAGITLKASDLFDLSLLSEVYAENPDLVAYER